MKDKHIFSKSYLERKETVLNALRHVEAAEKKTNTNFAFRTPIKVLASVALLSALTVSIYATVQLIDFRMEQNGDEVHVYANLNETGDKADKREDKPLRSWNTNIDDDEIRIRLNIPDLPSDMTERENTNGKYYSEDSSRAITINCIDLRRSALEQIIGEVGETQEFDAGGKPLYVIKSNNETAFYNRTAFILFEKEEIVLRLWVSYGITDDELVAMASTFALEETDDIKHTLPIMNEVNSSSDIDTPLVYVKKESSIQESELTEIGESVRANNDWYTATVIDVDVYDNVNKLNPDCILRKDFIERFTDDSGNLIPYDRTEVIWREEGGIMTKQFGETASAKKKLYVVTLGITDFAMDDLSEEDREDMLKACVKSFDLNSYSVANNGIQILSLSAVVDRKPEAFADSSESIYREYLGDNQWKVAFLLDEDIAEGNLVLNEPVGEVYVKIK